MVRGESGDHDSRADHRQTRQSAAIGILAGSVCGLLSLKGGYILITIDVCRTD